VAGGAGKQGQQSSNGQAQVAAAAALVPNPLWRPPLPPSRTKPASCKKVFGKRLTRHGRKALTECLNDSGSQPVTLIKFLFSLCAPHDYRSLLQNMISFIGLFCKRDV